MNDRMRLKAGGLMLSGLLTLLAGCSSEPAEQAQTETVSSALTSPDEVVTFTSTIPAGFQQSAVAVAANGTLALDDRAQLGGLVATNAGGGSARVGVQTVVGTLATQGPVTVAARSSVGTLEFSSTAVIDATAVVGSKVPNAPLTPDQVFTWGAHFTPCTANVTLTNKTQAVQPGSFCAVTVYSGSTLQLGAGTYYMQSLDLEPQTTLLIDDSAGPVVLYVRSSLLWKGTVKTASGKTPRLFTGYAGTNPVTLETPLAGTLVAPKAQVRLANSSLPNKGSISAAGVELSPDVKLTFVPSPVSNADLGAIGPADAIAARAAFAQYVGDPHFADVIAATRDAVSDSLTSYQQSLLDLTLYLNAHASLLRDPSQLSSAELAQLPSFTQTVRDWPAMQAVMQAGSNLLNDPATLSAALQRLVTAAGSPVPVVPPTHAQACGAGVPNVNSITNTFLSAETSSIKAVSTLALTSNAVSSAGVAACLLPTSTLSNLALPGVQPESFWHVFKHVLEAASAVVGIAAAIVAVVPCGACQVVGAVLGAVSGGLALGAAIIDATEDSDGQTANTCPGTAPTCKTDQDCAGTEGSDKVVCSFGCCSVTQTQQGLIDSGLVTCVENSDCASGQCGPDGCCAQGSVND